MTGGEIFFSNVADLTNAITDALRNLAQINLAVLQRVYTVRSLVFALLASITETSTVFLDSTLGQDCMFVFDYTGDGIMPGLTSPTGVSYDTTSTGVIHDSILRTYTFTIADSAFEVGAWTYSVTNPGSASVSVAVTVTSMVSVQQSATYVTNVYWTESNIPSQSAGLDHVVQIVSTVDLGSVPVLNAEVTAYVDSPGAIIPVTLLDNGVGGDTEADDGIYSAYFLDFADAGRYGLSVGCTGGSETVVNLNDILGESQDDLGFPSDSQQVPAATGEFERTQIGAALSLPTAFSTVTYPPSRITDLVATVVGQSNRTVLLEWTAVGDQLTVGTAASYDLRRGTDFNLMSTSFSTQTPVESSIIEGGDSLTTPLAAFTRQSITVRVPSNGEVTYVFAIKAVSSTGLFGDLSNIATVSMV